MLELIREFLAQPRLAVVGVSHQPNDFSRMLFRELRSRGYDAIPVHPAAREIDGAPCYARLQEVQPSVENALLMTSPAVTNVVVQDCAAAGVKRVWLYRAGGKGAVSPEAVAYCETHGIAVIPGECPFMFLPRGGWYHRFHGWVRKIQGTYPN
jgi:predicted CoA-binding protein